MSSEITCPVCHFGHIPWDSDTCPQCDSDLTCFKLLDAMPDLSKDLKLGPSTKAGNQTAGQEKSWADVGKTYKSKFPWFAFVLGVILLTLACLLGYAAHRFLAMESMMQKIDMDMGQVKNLLNMNPNKIIKTLEAGTRQMNHLEKRVEELLEITKENKIRLAPIVSGKKEMVSKVSEGKIDDSKNKDRSGKPCFNIYQAKDEDTLWTIARDLYGSGMFYPILMENNPDLSIYSIGSKDSIRYMCDKIGVAGIYKTIIGYKQNRPFWKYTVRPGDTRKGIIKRYCLNQKDCLVEDKLLKLGMTIGVFLE